MAIRHHLHDLLLAIAASRLARGGLALAIIFLVGSTGYMVIEGWSLFDAVYMTVLTMTTVGYEEVRPLSPLGRVFNLFIMLGGVGLMLYILTVTVQTVVEDEVLRVFMRRRRMKKKIDAVEAHFILCGFGRVGREAAAAIHGEDVDVVVVDSTEAAIAAAEEDGLLAICKDATHNATLLEAGIERARGLIIATGSDSDNVLITLTAKAINPNLTIVARADAVETRDKLRLAGADRVVTPYSIGGRRMALSAVKPLAADYFDSVVDRARVNPRIAEIAVVPGSMLVGTTIAALDTGHQVRVLAVSKQDGRLLLTPDEETIMEPGDRVVLVGHDEQLRRLEGEA